MFFVCCKPPLALNMAIKKLTSWRRSIIAALLIYKIFLVRYLSFLKKGNSKGIPMNTFFLLYSRTHSQTLPQSLPLSHFLSLSISHSVSQNLNQKHTNKHYLSIYFISKPLPLSLSLKVLIKSIFFP